MTLVLGLTEEQQTDRLTGIGGSDAPRIMAGDWMNLWLEKTGRVKPKKIMSDWNYFLRISTEKIQLDWWEHKTGQHITPRNTSVRSTVYPFIRATLDGIIEENGEPINAKHVSGFTPGNPRKWAEGKYIWQMVHEIVVTMPTTMRGWISLIVGENEPEPIPLDADPVSLDKLVETETEFWGYVQRNEPPDPNHPSVAPVTEWETMRTVNMAQSNAWAALAVIWLDNRSAAKWHYEAADELKKLVDKDVREAFGHGITCTRDRAGRLSIKERASDV